MWGKTLVVSGLLVLGSLAVLCWRGAGVLAVDFTGGTVVTFNYAEAVPQQAIESVLKTAGYSEPTVTYKYNVASGERKVEILIRGDLTGGTADSPKDALTAPVPTYIRMIEVISVVRLESSTAENARS